MVRRAFKDDELQRQIDEYGYCIINLLTEDEVNQLLEIYQQNKLPEQEGIEVTIKSSDYALNKKIKDLSAGIMRKMSSYLIDYRLFHSGFISKIPGKRNAFNLHQDATFVDEDKFLALNVWCPLTDVDESNGGLGIIPHSNLFFDGVRGQPFKEYDCTAIGNEAADKFGKVISMKAGQAFVYDPRLFHYSSQNNKEMRVVCNAVMLPAEAETVYYHYNKAANALEKYAIDDDFLLRYYGDFSKTGKIEARLINSKSYDGSHKVTIHEFEQKFYQYNKIESKI